MIGVEGQYLVSVTIGDQKDFLKEGDLLELTIVEEAGNVLPTTILTFLSENEKILPKLNEGQEIKVKLGRTTENLRDISLTTSKLNTQKEGDSLRIYETKGFASNINYITDHNINLTSKKSGIEAVIETAKRSFKVETNITKSRDKQVWIQHSISDKAFLNNCLMHSNIPSSFPVCAITADGKFILKDIKEELDAKSKQFAYDWKFTKEINSKKDIIFDSDMMLESNSGFMNNWMGYGRTTLVYNLLKGKVEEVFEQPSTYLALTNEIDKSNNINARFNGTRMISDNVDENYWKSYNHNLQGLATLSRIEMALSFSNEYVDIKPLDIIMFSEPSNDSEVQAAEYHSGLYIVSKVVRTIQKGRMSTTVLLNRESLNQVKNEV